MVLGQKYLCAISRISMLVLILLYAPSALAIGGSDASPATKIDKNTQGCQAEIAKKSRIYYQKVYDTVQKCIDGIIKCDEQSDDTKADACRAKLTADAKGACAEGKVDDGATNIGAGASDARTKTDKPALAKELAKYRDAIDKKCFDAKKPVDLTDPDTGLGFAAAADADRLMDQINADPGGITCLALGAIRLNHPLIDDITGVLPANGPGNTKAFHVDPVPDCVGGGAGPAPIGEHKCVVGAGSSIAITTEGFPIPPLPATGSIDIDCGVVDPNTGKAECTCDIQDFDPVVITAIGTACIGPAASPCPTGEIDCDGGNALDLDVTSDHNIGACTGNPDCTTQCDTYCGGISAMQTSSGCEGFCIGGASDGSACTMDTDCPGGSCPGGDGLPHGNICGCHCVEMGGAASPPGSLKCNLGTNIFVVLPAGSPCTDPPTISLGDSCIPITSTTATGTVLSANDGAGTFGSGPIVGSAFDCVDLATSVTSGGSMVGVVQFYDSTLGDLSVALTTVCM